MYGHDDDMSVSVSLSLSAADVWNISKAEGIRVPGFSDSSLYFICGTPKLFYIHLSY